jgi:uncharacterized protein (UPF0548 family)
LETGESAFTIEKNENNKVIFKVHTFSKPGNLLAKLVATFFTIPYQAFCTRRSPQNVKRQLERDTKDNTSKAELTNTAAAGWAC